MLKPDIHICLVYNTPISNITPALDPEFKPSRVLLVHSQTQREIADNLAAVLKPAGIQVEYWPLADTSSITCLREQFLDLLITWENMDIALNVSGGTHLMSLAAYEVFQEFGKPVFHIHPETDELTWLHRRDVQGFNIANQIKLPAYLRAHGAQVVSQGSPDGVPQSLRELTSVLANHAERLAKPLAALNWLAQQAKETLRSPPLSDSQLSWNELTALISAFAEQSVLTVEDNRLAFPDEAARFFVNGGWLEVHTYSLLYQLRSEIKGIQDIGRSIEISRQQTGQPVRNELDVAFSANNRLYIIECKTKRFSDHNTANRSVDTPGAEVLYKLGTLKTLLGGTRSEHMLISYHDLSRRDQQRAKDLNVEICTADQLGRLKQRLQHWIENTGGHL